MRRELQPRTLHLGLDEKTVRELHTTKVAKGTLLRLYALHGKFAPATPLYQFIDEILSRVCDENDIPPALELKFRDEVKLPKFTEPDD